MPQLDIMVRLKCNMLSNNTNILLLLSSRSFSTNAVFANISNTLMIGTLSIISVFQSTSTSSYVSFSYAEYVLLLILKNIGTPITFSGLFNSSQAWKVCLSKWLVYVL